MTDTTAFTPGQQVLWALYQSQLPSWAPLSDPATYLGNLPDWYGQSHDLYLTDAGSLVNVWANGVRYSAPDFARVEPIGTPIHEAYERARRLGLVTLPVHVTTQF